MISKEMNAAQLSTHYASLKARALHFLPMITASISPSHPRAARIGEMVTEISGKLDTADENDFTSIAAMASGAFGVEEVVDRLSYLLGDLRGQPTHAALVAERESETTNNLKEIRSGCCINCVIGYIGSDGQRYDRNRKPIGLHDSMGAC
jgi:hypothetical protein